ncbi:hypothetical protein PV08_00506 [Exophiala spinifera]|uniref:Pisatin demethylase n=1 Tax=Exophiala spinifera TaxID=91928 RepID=A0A0D1YXD1_9EURO|nr:uncharacterized protein PV08_00506 [Exophiala spinifera]KIW19931.1 hypothetical protein PV08_00506 [Exophiala spinifera]
MRQVDFYFLALVSFLSWYIWTSIKAWHRPRNVPALNLLATFSYLWLGRVTSSGLQFWVHRPTHRKYGPLVRIGPNEVATDDAEIVRQISPTKSSYPSGSWYKTGKFNPYRENLFSTTDIEEHKKLRARLILAYAGRNSASIEPAVDGHVAVMINMIRDRHSTQQAHLSAKLLRLEAITCFLTIDVISCLGFGEPLGNTIAENNQHGLFKSFHELWPQMSTCAEVPWIRDILFSGAFLKLFGPKTTDTKGFGAVMALAEIFVGRRFSTGEKKSVMLNSLIEHGFNREECESEALLMLLAGTESTACAIRSALVHAITCPAAVIYEGIRMRPPLLGFFPKVVPHPGANFHRIQLPAGTSIMTNVSALSSSTGLFGADADAAFTDQRDSSSSSRLRGNKWNATSSWRSAMGNGSALGSPLHPWS